MIFGDKIIFAKSAYDAVENIDCLLLLTEWNEFRKPDFERIRTLMNEAVVFDGRNQYNPKIMKEYGFEYHCIGKKSL